MGEYKRMFSVLINDIKENTVELCSNLGSNISELFSHTFIYIPKRLGFFVKRVYQLAPIIWNDRDFDWHYIMYYLKFKIQKTREHIDEHDILVNGKKYCQQMQKVEQLIDLAMDSDRYRDECEKPLKEKWGYSIAYLQDDVFNDEEVTNRCSRRMIFQRENWTAKLDKQIHKEEVAALRKAYRLHEKDWNKLWQHLNKYMRHWWD